MIPNPNLSLESYGELFEYTDAERAAVERYLGLNYKIINSLFVNNGGEYEKRNGMQQEFKSGNQENRDSYVYQMQETIKMMPLIYSAMMKFGVKEQSDDVMRIYHRGTSMHEIHSLTPGESLDRLVSATGYSEGANWQSYLHNENKDAPVHMQVRLDAHSGVPTIDADDIFPDASGWEKETIIAPFAQIKNVHNDGKRRTQRGSVYDEYTVTLEAPELELLSPNARESLGASVLERAPRIHDLIDQVLRRDSDIVDIEFKIDIASKRRREYIKERNMLNDELANLYYYSSETDLRDLINLWSYMLEKQERGDEIHVSDARMHGVMRMAEMYGLPLESYSPEIQEFLIREVSSKLENIDMYCHENDSFAQVINEAFGMVKLQSGISREEIFYELQRRMKGLSFQDVTPREMIAMLEDASEYFTNHLRVCGYGESERLEQTMERTKRKINEVEEDLQYIDDDERKNKLEVKKINESVEAILPEISQWKADIICICKSDCREVEIDFEKRIKEIEDAKKREAEVKQEVQVPKVSIAEETIITPSTTVDLDNVATQEVPVKEEDDLRKINVAANVLKNRFNPRNVRINSGTQGDLELIACRNMRVVAEIQNVTGTRYSSRINDYQTALGRAYHSVDRLVEAARSGVHSTDVLEVLNMANSIDYYAYEGEMEKEILGIQNADENLLKKVVFEKFCKVAICAEIASLSTEAKGIRDAASQRGFARLFKGVSKQEMTRCEQIEAFVESVSRPQRKPFMGKKYSYRDIMADMDLFIEQRGNDPRYANAIDEVQKLQGVLNTHYRANPRDIVAKKEQKRAEYAASGVDSRSFRITNLMNQMEDNGLITRSVNKEALAMIQQTERFITGKTQELTRRRAHNLQRSSTEISQ